MRNDSGVSQYHLPEKQGNVAKARLDADELHELAQRVEHSLGGFSVEDISTQPPPLRFAVDPYIPESQVSVLSGPGGAGKSTLSIQWAVARAMGLSFAQLFGAVDLGGSLRPEPNLLAARQTAFFSTEETRLTYRRKLYTMWKFLVSRGYDEEEAAWALSENIVVSELQGIRLVRSSKGGMFEPTLYANAVFTVLSKLENHRVDLVFMETVSRLTGGVETNDALSILVEAGEIITQAGTAVTFLHHVSQTAGQNKDVTQYATRGGTGLVDNARSSIVLMGFDNQPRTLALPKRNGVRPVPNLRLRPVSTETGMVLVEALPTETAECPQADDVPELLRRFVKALYAKRPGLDLTATRLRNEYRDQFNLEFGLSLSRATFGKQIRVATDGGALRPSGTRKNGGEVIVAADDATVPDDAGTVPASSRDHVHATGVPTGAT